MSWKQPLECRVHPAGDVRKTLWRKSAAVAKAPVDRHCVAPLEVLDHHIETFSHRAFLPSSARVAAETREFFGAVAR